MLELLLDIAEEEPLAKLLELEELLIVDMKLAEDVDDELELEELVLEKDEDEEEILLALLEEEESSIELKLLDEELDDATELLRMLLTRLKTLLCAEEVFDVSMEDELLEEEDEDDVLDN